MKTTVSPWMWLVPMCALILPPLLLIPLVWHLPAAQFFKDIYEVCLWLSPATGVIVLGLLLRQRRREPATFRSDTAIAAVILAGLDLFSPLFFYVLLAVLAGH